MWNRIMTRTLVVKICRWETRKMRVGRWRRPKRLDTDMPGMEIT
jgi:hypothetical protein